ncbi:MAG TPA: hypothetical protein VNM69_20600 [Bacillus sp. (in: firmicutes)]|uniref:hypothetical protein n=1 Tax=Bacillus litorisediminis TaxID=2922713 RepID=UPI001FAD3FAE|nr:hypothetical protein [Bacillus litorisediminis]HWO78272.1 hypothetical protein [Bacillus sp. (in: firmicutes)]
MIEEIRVLLYFSLMILSLIGSLFLAIFLFNKSYKLWSSFFAATIVNILILALSSYWWFATETDGISAGLGLLYNRIAIAVIAVITFVSLAVLNQKRFKKLSFNGHRFISSIFIG